MSMKNKILYVGIPFIFISLGFYYLNHTNTGDGKNNPINNQLDSVHLEKQKFQIPVISTNPIITTHIEDHKSVIVQKKIPDSDDIIALFSPRDDIRSTLINYIEAETEGIICAAFRLTDQFITKSFLSAHQKGVPLTFIIDKEGLSSMHSKVLHLFNSGIPVYIFPPVGNIEDTMIQGLMHNKIILLLGQKIVITGSFNFTKSAQDRNRENIVIIKNNDAIFNNYKNELDILMTESSKFQSQQTEKREFKKKIHKNKNKKYKKIRFNSNMLN